MGDVRSSPGDTQNEVSSSSRLPSNSWAAHAGGGGEQKATIHKAPPESRPRTRPPLDPDSPDDLTGIRGIDRALADKLQRTGITHFDQIADWSPTDVRSLSAALSLGRSIYAQNWIEQAARLARMRRDAEMRGTASQSRPAAGSSESRQLRSIASLVASAASAIRARVRMNEAREKPAPHGQYPYQATTTPVSANTPAFPRMIDPLELATRVSAKFRQIGAAAGIAAAAFPKQDILRSVKPEAKPDASPETAPEPAAILEPVPADWHSPATATEMAAEATAEPTPIEAALRACNAPSPATDAAPRLPDDLRLISNLPQDVSDRLNALGIRYFYEIASFNADDIAALSVDCALGERVNRECWVEQAAMLATGAITKAAGRRARGELSCLTASPSAPLEREHAAFAALITRPAVSHGDTAAPGIEVDEPCPDAPEGTPTPSVKPGPPLVTVAPVAVADAAVEAVPATASPRAPATASADDRRDDPAGFPDHEEAEVTIRPRAPTPTGASTGIFSFDGGSDLHADAFAEPAEPGSMASQLSQRDRSENSDPAGQSNYLRHVAEAFVEIVPARPATPSRPRPSQTAAPDAVAASTLADIAAAPKSVNRFLKALRGH